MQKKLVIVLMVSILLLTSACQPTPTPAPTATVPPPTNTPAPTPTPVPPTATPTEAPPTNTSEAPILQVLNPAGEKNFTLAELKQLPASEGYGGIKSSTGKITPPVLWKGVSLKDLVEAAGGMEANMGINIEAKDGYGITYSYDQVMNGTFISYDPGTGDELKSPAPLTAILAYEREGKDLDLDMDGTLRLVIISDDNKQVTDGHWSVKWVTKIEIKDLGQNWNLRLEGAISEDMDRATFESGASPNCHMLKWTDDKAQEWVGIALWLLVGRVDDEIKHEGPAFNDALADAGYTIDVVASDGYTVSFESARVKRNDNIIVAYQVNGNPLPDKYFPLRLVGADLQKDEMVGMIAKIVVNVPALPVLEPTPTPEPTATTAPVADAALVVTGLVETELSFTDADLHALEVVKITAEHPKKGKLDYEGVRLNALLDLAKVKPEAKTLVLIAGDGFKAEVDLAAARAQADCLLAFTDTAGDYSMVMPGLPSNTWVKGVVKIEVK